MNYSHVAHDCVVGSNVVMANAATLAGHVVIEDYAIVGGLVAVHQHVKLGAHCIIGGASAVSKDIPFRHGGRKQGARPRLNLIGLRRRGFSKGDIDEIKRSFKILFRSSMPLKEAAARLKEELPDSLHAKNILSSLKARKGALRA